MSEEIDIGETIVGRVAELLALFGIALMIGGFRCEGDRLPGLRAVRRMGPRAQCVDSDRIWGSVLEVR